MSSVFDLSERTEVRLVIAFIDCTRFNAWVFKTEPTRLAEVVDDYYHRIAAAVEPAGGRVIKYIGDGSLIAFPIDRAGDGVIALLELKDSIDGWFARLGWDSRLIAKVHAGEVIAGPFGPTRELDLIGREVNVAATVSTRGFALTAEAFRSLDPETRKRFKKHTPPITYIRAEDPRPHRTGRAI
jgi:adenylate cyclase